MTYNLRFAGSAVHNSGCFCSSGSSIDDDIGDMTPLFVNQFGVDAVFDLLILILHRCAQYRVTQLSHDLTDDIIVGNTDADGFFILVYFW